MIDKMLTVVACAAASMLIGALFLGAIYLSFSVAYLSFGWPDESVWVFARFILAAFFFAGAVVGITEVME